VATGEAQDLSIPEGDTPSFSPDLDSSPGYQGQIAFRLGDDIAAVEVTIDTSDNLSTGNFSWLTDTPDIRENYPDWSPDGQYVAFQRLTINAPLESNDTGISIIDVTTGARMDVADTIRSDVRPTWSPDGLDIAYYDARPVGRKGNKFTTDIFYVSPWLPDPPINVTNTDSTRDLEYVPDWNPALD
jgi:Tol biopolymer transport system component